MIAESIFLVPNGTFIVELALIVLILYLMAKYVLPAAQQGARGAPGADPAALEAADDGRAEAAAADDERARTLDEARAPGPRDRRRGPGAAEQVKAEAEEPRRRPSTTGWWPGRRPRSPVGPPAGRGRGRARGRRAGLRSRSPEGRRPRDRRSPATATYRRGRRRRSNAEAQKGGREPAMRARDSRDTRRPCTSLGLHDRASWRDGLGPRCDGRSTRRPCGRGDLRAGDLGATPRSLRSRRAARWSRDLLDGQGRRHRRAARGLRAVRSGRPRSSPRPASLRARPRHARPARPRGAAGRGADRELDGVAPARGRVLRRRLRRTSRRPSSRSRGRAVPLRPCRSSRARRCAAPARTRRCRSSDGSGSWLDLLGGKVAAGDAAPRPHHDPGRAGPATSSALSTGWSTRRPRPEAGGSPGSSRRSRSTPTSTDPGRRSLHSLTGQTVELQVAAGPDLLGGA